LQHLRSTKALTQSSLGDKNKYKQQPKNTTKWGKMPQKGKRKSGKMGECKGESHRLRAALNVSPQPIADVNTCTGKNKKGYKKHTHTI